MNSNAVSEVRVSAGDRLADLHELTKPGITFMVLVTTGIGFLLAAQRDVSWLLLLHTLLGTWLVAAGASVLNQVLERDTDALMHRTAKRPLPAGRIHPDAALLFGVALAVAGLLVLIWLVNLLTALLGALALAAYVFAYTPLKRATSLATIVGAVPGAMPPLMGWASVEGTLAPGAWVLFGILFLWQLPHFLSIAWLCRADYERAGFPMLTVLDPDGRRTARQMIIYGAALLPVSLLPSLLGLTGVTYFVGALVLGLGFLGFCFAFSLSHSTRAARHLLLASVLYLPVVLLVMLLDRAV